MVFDFECHTTIVYIHPVVHSNTRSFARSEVTSSNDIVTKPIEYKQQLLFTSLAKYVIHYSTSRLVHYVPVLNVLNGTFTARQVDGNSERKN